VRPRRALALWAPRRRATQRPSPRGWAASLLALAVLTGGCAERNLVAEPSSRPGAGTWVAVWVAAGLAALVIGVLLTLPVWRSSGGARLAAAVLTVQTGALAVTTAVLTGYAIRSRQLLERPADAEPAVSLLRLSRIDGDEAFLTLMVILTVVLGSLATTLTALAARFAASTDPVERSIASTILGLELGAAAYALVRLLLGARGWPYLVGGLAAPVLAAALVSCWPRRQVELQPA
jgi:hypothetical protein